MRHRGSGVGRAQTAARSSQLLIGRPLQQQFDRLQQKLSGDGSVEMYNSVLAGSDVNTFYITEYNISQKTTQQPLGEEARQRVVSSPIYDEEQEAGGGGGGGGEKLSIN
ncbi:unnamed protein product [Pleuronectes platessa]|uniref:Uncharacterized protein n=1 Tax=Pleuronectes platessa TaxID=8262 RepID=A0A9N7V0N9_PLEPL|nr:unnamed protein product [Pleuronectes platessa]